MNVLVCDVSVTTVCTLDSVSVCTLDIGAGVCREGIFSPWFIVTVPQGKVLTPPTRG